MSAPVALPPYPIEQAVEPLAAGEEAVELRPAVVNAPGPPESRRGGAVSRAEHTG